MDMILLQETKKLSFAELFVRSIWPNDDLGYIGVDAEGSAGACCACGSLMFFSLRIVAVLGTSFCYQVWFIIGIVYAPNDCRDRSQLWKVLTNLKASFPKPWCLGEDFNEIKNIGEQIGCVKCDRGMQKFNEF